MTPEQLMKPRRKVMMDFPGNECFVGQILTKDNDQWRDAQGWLINYRVENYPEIFQELPWWCDREANEMPDYVKHHGEVNKASWVEGVTTENSHQLMRLKLVDAPGNWQVTPNVMCFFEIATEQEYNEYQKSKTP